MTIDQLKKKIGFQIGFMQFSGKTEEQTIEDITQLAIEYGDQYKLKAKQFDKLEAKKSKTIDV